MADHRDELLWKRRCDGIPASIVGFLVYEVPECYHSMLSKISLDNIITVDATRPPPTSHPYESVVNFRRMQTAENQDSGCKRVEPFTIMHESFFLACDYA